MNFKSVLIILCISNSLNAQNEVNLDTIPNLFRLVNTLTMPHFNSIECEEFQAEELRKCSQNAMWKFIYSNIRYPHNACIEGIVVVRFLIEVDGSIQEPEILRDIGGGTGKEAIRVVNLMPNWVPGKESGRIVPLYFNLPIRFRLESF